MIMILSISVHVVYVYNVMTLILYWPWYGQACGGTADAGWARCRAWVGQAAGARRTRPVAKIKAAASASRHLSLVRTKLINKLVQYILRIHTGVYLQYV